METIDLTPFCSTSKWRPYLTRPFHIDDRTYATDGLIMVRVPRSGEVELSTELVPENIVEQIRQWFSTIGDMTFEPAALRLPAGGPPKMVKCGACEGRGHEHDCPDCSCKCEECEGSGRVEKTVTISADIGKSVFDIEIVRKIANLPGLELSTPGEDSPLYFRFDGGEGIVMNRRRHADRHVGTVVCELSAAQ
jgi:hypothetical protein